MKQGLTLAPIGYLSQGQCLCPYGEECLVQPPISRGLSIGDPMGEKWTPGLTTAPCAPYLLLVSPTPIRSERGTLFLSSLALTEVMVLSESSGGPRILALPAECRVLVEGSSEISILRVMCSVEM